MNDLNADQTKRPFRWWILLIIVLGIPGLCLLIRGIVFQIKYGGKPIAAIARGFPPDCVWSGTAIAWIDENENGIQESFESPLPGVGVQVNGDRQVTNWKGEAGLHVWLPGCPDVEFVIYPDVPDGYQLTTEERLYADDRESDLDFAFGFSYLPTTATATPRPPIPECRQHKVAAANQHDLTDLIIASDGTVWIATFGNGVASYLEDADQWEYFREEDGLVNNHVRSITEINGTLWFASDGGATSFDGKHWDGYTTEEGLINDNVYKIAGTENGPIWFATQEGISRYDASLNKWVNYTSQDGLADDFVTYAAVTPDGTIWFSTLLEGVSRYFPDQSSNGPGIWKTYSDRAEGEAYIPLDSFNDLEVDAEGMVWLGGNFGLVKYDPLTSGWTEIDNAGSVESFEIAQDGSIWIASESNGPLVYHFITAGDPTSPHSWHIYDSRDGLPTIPDYRVIIDPVEAIDLSRDGSVWIATREHATRCLFK